MKKGWRQQVMQPALDEDEWQELQEERQNLVDEIRALKRAKDEDTYIEIGLDLEIELAVVEEQLKRPKADYAPFSFRSFEHVR